MRGGLPDGRGDSGGRALHFLRQVRERLPDGGDLSVEDIVNLNPDVIIVDYMDDENLTPEESKTNAINSVTGEAALAEVSAVKNGKVMAINLTDVYGGGIRMVPAVETMFNFMYGN